MPSSVRGAGILWMGERSYPYRAHIPVGWANGQQWKQVEEIGTWHWRFQGGECWRASWCGLTGHYCVLAMGERDLCWDLCWYLCCTKLWMHSHPWSVGLWSLACVSACMCTSVHGHGFECIRVCWQFCVFLRERESVCVCVCVCVRREVCDSDLPRLWQKLRYEVGGRGFLSHAYSGVGVGPPGCPRLCGKKVWEQPECVCISWVIDDAGEQAVFPWQM